MSVMVLKYWSNIFRNLTVSRPNDRYVYPLKTGSPQASCSLHVEQAF